MNDLTKLHFLNSSGILLALFPIITKYRNMEPERGLQ